FAQWMALPCRRHQDAPQMRMAVEDDAEHVPHLALVPVGRGPDAGDGVQRRALVRERHLDPHVLVALEGEQVIDDREVARGLVAAGGADALVNGREIVEEAIGPLRLCLEIAQHLKRFIPRRPERGYPVAPVAYGLWPDGRFAEDLLQLLENRVAGHRKKRLSSI